MRTLPVVALVLLLGAAPEPPARPARPLPLLIDSAITHVSAARELPDGRVLVSDQEKPAVYLLDPKTGKATTIGSAGADALQYVQPGCFYGGPAGTILLFDRGQAKVLTIDKDGRMTGSASIAVRGTTSSSNLDVDRKRVDSRGFAYFPERDFGPGTNTPLLRFDPVKQARETVTTLRVQEYRETAGGDGMTFGRTVIGSPADGWAVTPDGHVAVVRAVPYRVEWFAPDGSRVQGPIVDHDPLPMTEEDKQAWRAKYGRGRGGAGAGMPGSASGQPAETTTLFAATKPPFEPDDIALSLDGRVWVKRSGALGAKSVVYDVFDQAGRRTARIELPAGSHVVGFGPSTPLGTGPTSIYVRQPSPGGATKLTKYSEK